MESIVDKVYRLIIMVAASLVHIYIPDLLIMALLFSYDTLF